MSSTCANKVVETKMGFFWAAANADVWVVVGSPGAARGTSLSATVAFVFGASTSPWMFASVQILQLWDFDGVKYDPNPFLGQAWILMAPNPCTNCDGKPVYRGVVNGNTLAYLRLSPAT